MQTTTANLPQTTKDHRVVQKASASHHFLCADQARTIKSRFPSVDDVLAEIDQIHGKRDLAAA